MVSVISGKRPLENGECSLPIAPPKYKRRKVSAVRDFPPGCGPNASQINMQTKEVGQSEQKAGDITRDVECSGEKGGDLCEVEENRCLEKLVESQSHDIRVCSSGVETQTSSLAISDMEHGSGDLAHLVDGICKEILENPKSSQDSQRMKEESTSKDEIHDISKDSMDVMIELPSALNDTGVLDLKEAVNDTKSEMMDEGISIEPCLLPYHPIPSNLVWKERKYPPRRRVSANRDFPAGCGRNVPKLGQTKEKHLDQGEIEANIHKELTRNDDNRVGDDFDTDNAFRNKMKGIVSGKSEDKLEGQSDEINGQQEFCEDNNNSEQHGRKMEEVGRDGKDEMDIGGSPDGESTELVVYVKDRNKRKKSVSMSLTNIKLQEEDIDDAENGKERVVVQGLMSSRNCPWGSRRVAVKSTPAIGSSIKLSKGNKNDDARQDKCKRLPNKSKNKEEILGEKSKTMRPYLKEKERDYVSRQLVLDDREDSYESKEVDNDFALVPRRRDFGVSLPPFGASSSSSEKGARSKVRETLRLFQAVVRKLLQGEETKSKKKENALRRVDLRASNILKNHGKFVNIEKIIGPVPGVEVGDEFHYRMELHIIGLHRPSQGGIDYLKQGEKFIAISIVASGGYANDVDNSDMLIYTGQGGNATGGDKKPEDQKLERGNLALKNSIDEENFVRVIRGSKESKLSENADGRYKLLSTYIYDGLYTVKRYWGDLGPHGKLVYKFELKRVPGQPELAWKEVKKSKKFKVREGRCVDDISKGKETIAICAVNTIDDEKPPEFTYITSMIYPSWCQPIPSRGCDCKNGCLDSKHCACTVKNGGEIPYNYNGAIVEAKPLVYECGPTCKCPPSCHNRVAQNGIKFPLEIFKTESRGWGVRSLSSIPSGSFICEYIGELLDDREAEQRTGNDEYLFDIGQNYNDPTLWDGLSVLIPEMPSSLSDVVENVGFTIDAAKRGNIGRFINHSCSPNLYAQNVLYDHEDKRIPHIMFFAAENIPPLQELTYHYNYMLDQVFDSDGNIKKKNCYCGSSECTGRMY